MSVHKRYHDTPQHSADTRHHADLKRRLALAGQTDKDERKEGKAEKQEYKTAALLTHTCKYGKKGSYNDIDIKSDPYPLIKPYAVKISDKEVDRHVNEEVHDSDIVVKYLYDLTLQDGDGKDTTKKAKPRLVGKLFKYKTGKDTRQRVYDHTQHTQSHKLVTEDFSKQSDDVGVQRWEQQFKINVRDSALLIDYVRIIGIPALGR